MAYRPFRGMVQLRFRISQLDSKHRLAFVAASDAMPTAAGNCAQHVRARPGSKAGTLPTIQIIQNNIPIFYIYIF